MQHLTSLGLGKGTEIKGRKGMAPGLSRDLKLIFKKYLFLLIYLVCQVLVVALWDLFPWPAIEPGPPALGARGLSHWTREVPWCSDFVQCDVLWKLQRTPHTHHYWGSLNCSSLCEVKCGSSGWLLIISLSVLGQLEVYLLCSASG